MPLDWHFRTEEPRRINPGSQLNVILFGYTVRLPDIEPFMGEDRPPQFTATKVKIIPTITKIISKQFLRVQLLTTNHILATFRCTFTETFIPTPITSGQTLSCF